MPKFNVHIFREYRLRFDGVEAATPEAAAEIARHMMQEQSAIPPENCNGETLSALVDQADVEEPEGIPVDFFQLINAKDR